MAQRTLFPSQSQLLEKMRELDTLTQVGTLMDWTGVDADLISHFEEIQLRTLKECWTHIEQFNNDVDSALHGTQNDATNAQNSAELTI